jgi:hypothetical protein
VALCLGVRIAARFLATVLGAEDSFTSVRLFIAEPQRGVTHLTEFLPKYQQQLAPIAMLIIIQPMTVAHIVAAR